jgi:hypothetical protein
MKLDKKKRGRVNKPQVGKERSIANDLKRLLIAQLILTIHG